ncbi:ribosome silencing factor [Fibrobacter sp. UWB10]|uniref:ribosome silencing factor n=1 Tax=Fibrobacter sp. UWB10 TaxID=1896201 RepID=UPI00156A9DF5|nr:ribosome silencing factor [Fibrobacter sp. UWB10]MBO7512274.1 ribosome silencing factor [Fibrobacter sp.]SMP38625.1 ribosome-associated protein [Fibrobacter sp. UWB10]
MTTKITDLPESVNIGASILFELRAQNVQLIDLRGIKDVTDFFLVATCESEAQMQAILNELRKEFKANKLPSVGVEYKEGVRWAVFDAGLDLMVHLFEEEKRNEISLDRLYADGKIENLDENDFVKKTSKKKSSEDELV